MPLPPRVLNAPNRIWLVYGEIWHDDEHAKLAANGDVGWCDERVEASDVEYVRADLLEAAEALLADYDAWAQNVVVVEDEESLAFRNILNRLRVAAAKARGAS